jgi:hypothetical protein
MANAPPPWFQFVYASQMPTPGAMAYGFESEMLAMRPMIGPAIGYSFQWRSIGSAPQAYQAAGVSWQTGLTGIVHGQSVLQPLSNPYG